MFERKQYKPKFERKQYKPKWVCSSAPDEYGGEVWSIHFKDDDSYEATACQFWSGKHDNKALAQHRIREGDTVDVHNGINQILAGVQVLHIPSAPGDCWIVVDSNCQKVYYLGTNYIVIKSTT